MTPKEILFSAVVILVAAFFIFRPLGKSRDAEIHKIAFTAFTPKGLVAPFNCTVFLRPVGGSAGATSELGLGTTPEDFQPLISDLPKRITGEVVELGGFQQGTVIPLAIKTQWGGDSYAFFGREDQGSLGAFTDTDGSLEALGKQVVEPIGERFLMHLDDAASFQIDDNDQDLLIELWFEPTS